MRRSWLILLVMILFASFVVNHAIVQAQEAPAAEEKAGTTAPKPKIERQSVLTIVLKYSGVPGWGIIMMSVVAVYLIIRFAYQLRRNEVLPEALLTQLEEDLDAKRVREAIEKCQMDDSALARLVEGGLAEIRGGHAGMIQALEELSEAENVRVQQQVGWLAIIGAIAPMMGLTGTVLGMMGAFATIAASDAQPSPKALAENIQMALVTTCEGLIVAVPVLLSYAALRNRVTSLMLEVSIVATGLIDRFKHIQITPSMLAGVEEAVSGGGPAAPAEAAPGAEDMGAGPPPPPPA